MVAATPSSTPTVNILLLQSHEIASTGLCALQGRRAKHLREVLHVEVGTTVRAGVLNGALGSATVVTVDAHEVTVQIQLDQVPQPLEDVLLLAVPRPKVLLRMLSHAAAMGFARIILFRCWRVDKSWLQSRAFHDSIQRDQLTLGLEQAGRTQLPQVVLFDRFKPMLEDVLPQQSLPSLRLLAHPSASTGTHQLGSLGIRGKAKQPLALAIGPEGGFLPYEVDKFAAIGFHPISCGPHALRTETALAAIWGQLELLRQRP